MRVVVVNAGLGGVVVGAHRAGARVAAAFDSDATLVAGLRANLEGHDLLCDDVAVLDLRDDQKAPRRLAAALEAHPAANDLHVHVSVPPGKAEVEAGRVQETLALFETRGDASWSIVVKVAPETRRVLAEASARESMRVAFDTYDSSAFGAPQTRQRLVVGPPELMRALRVQKAAVTTRQTVRTALEASGLRLPSSHLKNQTKSSHTAVPCTRSVDRTAYTLCGSHALTWCDAEGRTTRLMTSGEGAVLQGLPSDWTLPESRKAAQAAVGSATCAALGEAIVRAATEAAKLNDEGQPLALGAVVGAAGAAGEDEHAPFVMTQKQYCRLKRRLNWLEEALAEFVQAKATKV